MNKFALIIWMADQPFIKVDHCTLPSVPHSDGGLQVVYFKTRALAETALNLLHETTNKHICGVIVECE